MIKDDEEPVITHEHMRKVAVAELRRPQNAWMEAYWDRRAPDGTGTVMPEGS